MITVSMADLNSASTKLMSLALENSKIDILKCVKISAAGGIMTITANNLEIQATCTVKCDGELQDIAVNASRFFGVIKTAAKQSIVSIDAKGDRVKISAGKSKWDLPSMPSDMFPVMNPSELTDSGSVDSSIWRNCLSKVKAAQSTQPHQYNLCGTFAHSVGGKMTLAATNGNSLHKVDTGIESRIDDLIIPSQLISTLLSSLPEKGEVEIKHSDRMIQFSWEGCTILGKTIDGIFPQYSNIIPEQSNVRITVDTASMLSAIASVIPVADHKSKRVKVFVQSDKITIENIDQYSGIASSEFPAIVDGFTDEFYFGLNGVSVSELLSSSDCETVIIDNTENAIAMKILKITPTVENGFSACISPMKM